MLVHDCYTQILLKGEGQPSRSDGVTHNGGDTPQGFGWSVRTVHLFVVDRLLKMRV